MPKAVSASPSRFPAESVRSRSVGRSSPAAALLPEAGVTERVGLLAEEVDDEQVMIESLTGFP
jgi:hypothetical protein